MVRQTSKCIICEHRPAKAKGFCAQCYGHIERERQKTVRVEPQYFLHYRGSVVGLYPNGGKTLKARLLNRNVEHLPKSKLINLDVYCEGYSREVIKRFKACVLQLAHA